MGSPKGHTGPPLPGGAQARRALRSAWWMSLPTPWSLLTAAAAGSRGHPRFASPGPTCLRHHFAGGGATFRGVLAFRVEGKARAPPPRRRSLDRVPNDGADGRPTGSSLSRVLSKRVPAAPTKSASFLLLTTKLVTWAHTRTGDLSLSFGNEPGRRNAAARQSHSFMYR